MYALLFQQIKNQIKDIVITKLLDKIIRQDKEITKYKNELDDLKFNLLLVLKQNVIDKSRFPLASNKNSKSLGSSFLSPNASKSGITKTNLSKLTITQYSSNDTNGSKINTLYKRNKEDLTLSPSYTRPSIEYDLHRKNKQSSSAIHINTSQKYNCNNIESQKQMKLKHNSELPLRKIPKTSQTNKHLSISVTSSKLNKRSIADSMIIHNKSCFGTSRAVENTKKEKNTHLLKIQKKIISKVRLLNQIR